MRGKFLEDRTELCDDYVGRTRNKCGVLVSRTRLFVWDPRAEGFEQHLSHTFTRSWPTGKWFTFPRGPTDVTGRYVKEKRRYVTQACPARASTPWYVTALRKESSLPALHSTYPGSSSSAFSVHKFPIRQGRCVCEYPAPCSSTIIPRGHRVVNGNHETNTLMAEECRLHSEAIIITHSGWTNL